MTSQTARQDGGDTRTAATSVPAQRTGDAPAVPDPLVGPPVPRQAVPDAGRRPQRDGAGARTAAGDTGAAATTTTPTTAPTATPTVTTTGPTTNARLQSASTGELVKRLSTQLSELVRGELELARAELTAKGKRAGTGAGLAGAGGVVALYGLGALIAAAVAALALVLPVWLSALIVGAVLLLVAGVLALAGRSQLRRATPAVPREAVENVQRDVETVKGAVHR